MEEKSINKNYILEAEILTPVHVGAGDEKDWLENADFVHDKGKVYLLDHKKVMNAIGPDKFAHALTGTDKSSLKRVLPGPVKDYASKVMECHTNTQNRIKAQVRTGLRNKPIIPGSSLKGALRSVIIHHLKPANGTNNNSQLNKEVMGSSTDGDEFGRFFKVTDISLEETKLINSKIFNLHQNDHNFESGWKHAKNNTEPYFNPKGFNTVYEVIAPGQKGTLDLKLAEVTWKKLKQERSYMKKVEEKTKIIEGSIKDLFGIINNYTRDYLEKEIAFFKKYNQAEHTDKILNSLTDLKNRIPDHNSYCIMRLAAGSGFHSITGDWRLESHFIDKLTKTIKTRKGLKTISRGMLDGQESAKSRKIAVSGNQFMPMGFIQLREMTAEEIKAREDQERQKREAAHKQRELEAKRREEERLKEEKIQKLFEQANDLLAKEQFTEALQKLDEAGKISPGDKRLAGKKETIENARKAYEERLREEKQRKAFEEERLRKAEELKKRQEANKAKKEKEKQQTLEQGLSKLTEIQDYNLGRKYIESYFHNNGNKIPEGEKNRLKDFVSRMKQQKPKDWKKVNKGNWKLVSKWIGKEKAQQWFEEMK